MGNKIFRYNVILVMVLLLFVFTGCGRGSDKAADDTASSVSEKSGNTPVPKGYKEPVDGAVQIDITNSDRHQTIDGFGAGYTYYNYMTYYTQYKEEVYDLLFKDAHLSILRFKNSYGYNEEEGFDPKIEKDFYDAAKKRLEEDGIEPKVLMSSWSPALYLKDSESLYGTGTLAKDEDGNVVYDDYGRYWAELVQAYRDNGVPIDYLSIQNEPDYVASYESCTFDFDETKKGASYPKAFLAVYDAVNKLDNPPKMLGPETMSCDEGDISLMMNEIMDTRPETVYGICHHLYVGGEAEKPRSFNSHFMGLKMEYPDKAKWMTEYYLGDFMQTAQIIQNALLYEDLNSYIFWGGVWLGKIDREVDALIGMDSGQTDEEFDHYHGYNIGEKYYSMRHFSEYILPDYVRVGTKVNYDTGDSLDTDSLSCSAFISPDNNTLVMVAINDLDESKMLQFQLGDYEYSSGKVMLTDYSAKDKTEKFYEDAGKPDNNNCFEIPAHSVITVVLNK